MHPKKPDGRPSVLLIRDGEVTWHLLNVVGSLATTHALTVLLHALGLGQVHISVPHLGLIWGVAWSGTDCYTNSSDDSRGSGCYWDSAAMPCIMELI